MVINGIKKLDKKGEEKGAILIFLPGTTYFIGLSNI